MITRRPVHILSGVLHRHFDLLRQCKIEVRVAAVLFLLPALTIIMVVDSREFHIESVKQQADFFDLLIAILVTNIPSALFLFAGVATLGILAAIGCLLLGMFLGFSVEAALSVFGARHVIMQTWLYTPAEIYGFVLAGASGLVSARRVILLGENPRSAYLGARSAALSLLASSIIVLTISALVEATIAASTHF